MANVEKAKLLDLKMKHSSLAYTLENCVKLGKNCTYANRLVASIKNQFSLEEKTTEMVGVDFPPSHLLEHRDLVKRLEQYEKQYISGEISIISFAQHALDAYLSHHFIFDKCHYSDLLSHCHITDISN